MAETARISDALMGLLFVWFVFFVVHWNRKVSPSWSARTSLPLLRLCSNTAGAASESRGDQSGQFCAYKLRFTKAVLNADFSGLQSQRGCGRGRKDRPGRVHSNEAKTATLKTALVRTPERRFRRFVAVQIPRVPFRKDAGITRSDLRL